MSVSIDFIFTIALAMAGLVTSAVLLYCFVLFVIMAAKKIKEEVQKDDRTE